MTQPKTNIVLTGMPGSGKSTVGVLLAKELLMDFLDTDVLIQTREGCSLQDIVDARGVETLLDIEERVVCDLAVSNTVIAPGGSVVLRAPAIDALKRDGVIVFLDVPLSEIEPRIDLYSRGMVRAPGDTLDDVWRKREPYYRAAADHTIPCAGLTQTEVAQRIASLLRV